MSRLPPHPRRLAYPACRRCGRHVGVCECPRMIRDLDRTGEPAFDEVVVTLLPDTDTDTDTAAARIRDRLDAIARENAANP